MTQPSDLNPVLRRRQIGAQLRQMREAAGRTLDEVADYLACSAAKVSRIENGRIVARIPDVRHMLSLYGISDAASEEMLKQIQSSQQPGWWREYAAVMNPSLETLVGLIDAAKSIQWYDPTLVPGLLQTSDYFQEHAAARNDDANGMVDQLLKLQMRLNAVLTRSDPPAPQFHAIIDEAALSRRPSGAAVMRDQVLHLIKMAALPNVTIQILPFSVGFSASHVNFSILVLPDPTSPTTVGLDQLSGVRLDSKPESIGRYAVAFDVLKADALDPEQSNAFLTDLAEKI